MKKQFPKWFPWLVLAVLLFGIGAAGVNHILRMQGWSLNSPSAGQVVTFHNADTLTNTTPAAGTGAITNAVFGPGTSGLVSNSVLFVTNTLASGTNEFRGARILKTGSSQSIPANTATLVTFNTVVYDTDNMTTSANQLTMPRDGYYHITAQLYWNASGAGTSNFLRQTTIRIGGSVGKDIGGEINYQVDNELCMQNASAVIYMLASDPVTVIATHTRSAAETILVDATFDGCFLEAVYLGSDVAAGGVGGPTTNAPPYTVPITGTNFIIDWLALGPTNDVILTNYAAAGVLHTNLVRGKRLIARIDQGGQGFCTLVANTNHFGPNNRFTAIITGITQSTNGGYQDFFGWYGSGTNAVAMMNNWGAAP